MVNKFGDCSGEGTPGPQRKRGLQGETGDQGPSGPKGSKGDRGLQGIEGNEGSKGDRGLQGIEGNEGPKGDRGIQGLEGVEGPQGETGPRGKTGRSGTPGDSILYRWFPKKTLSLLRENEDFCYYFKDKFKDFLWDSKNITGFKSHDTNGFKDAISVKQPVQAQSLSKPKMGFYAVFNQSLLKIQNTAMAAMGVPL